MLIAPKWLKLTCMFPSTVRTWLLKFFQKGAWPESRDPVNYFWALNANSSKRVKAMYFKVNPLNAKYLSGICYSVRQILFVVNNKHATKFAAGSPLYWTPAVNRLAITSILGSGDLPNFSRNPLLWVPAVKGLMCMFPGTVRTWPVKNFSKGGICKNQLGRDMHSREYLLVLLLFLSVFSRCHPSVIGHLVG